MKAATAKALLEKQRHKVINKPAMNWRNVPDFYRTLCKATIMIQLALHLLILTGVRTHLLHQFVKIRLKRIYEQFLAREYERSA